MSGGKLATLMKNPMASTPFNIFVNFIKNQARLQSNQNYETLFNNNKFQKQYIPKQGIKVLQSNVSQELPKNQLKIDDIKHTSGKYCHHHQTSAHSLIECNAFRRMNHADKKNLIYSNKLCFKCLDNHYYKNCKSNVKCDICNLEHMTIMHRTAPKENKNSNDNARTDSQNSTGTILCTKVCGTAIGKSC